MKNGKVIPLSALARELGWSVWKLHRLVKANQIPHVRIGPRRDVYFEEAAIERWLAQRRVGEEGARATVEAAPRRVRTIREECVALGLDPDPAFIP